MDYRDVAVIAMVEGAVLALLVSFYLGRSYWMVRATERRAHDYRAARTVLSRFAATGRKDLGREDMAVLERLARSQQISLFAQVASILSAEDRRFANGVAKRLGLVRFADRMSRSRWWWKRLQAVRFLASLGAGPITPHRFLDDPRLEVRSQAAEWAGDLGDPQWVPQLLRLLADPEGLCRYTVQDALQRIGAPVAGPLRTHLSEIRDVTALTAALTVAEKVADVRLLEPVLALTRHDHPAVRALACRTLAAVGGERALGRLHELTGDDDAEVRRGAIAGLAALGGVGSVAIIARHLSDPSWNVRREAGLALRDLGAPGRVILRAQTRSEDRFARDMASLVLELPVEPEGR